MASAPTTKIGNGQLPPEFVSPFKRVPMQGSHDALLALTATLSGKTADEVRKMAITLGMRATGAFYLDEVLFRKCIFNLTPLAVSEYNILDNIGTSIARWSRVILCVGLRDVNNGANG